MFKIKKVNSDVLKRKIGGFLFKYSGVIFILFFMAVAMAGAYMLYMYVYNSTWTQEEKDAYLKTKQSSIRFDRGKFDEAIKTINQSKEFSQKEFVEIKDIF